METFSRGEDETKKISLGLKEVTIDGDGDAIIFIQQS